MVTLDKKQALEFCKQVHNRGFTLEIVDGYRVHWTNFVDSKKSGDFLISFTGIKYYLK